MERELTGLQSSEVINHDSKIPKFWQELTGTPRAKEVNEFEIGLLVQKMCITGKESYLLFDDQGNRIARQNADRMSGHFSVNQGGLVGLFQGEPNVLIHTHPGVLNDDEDSLLNIVDLPSPDDLDNKIHNMIIWGEEGAGFFATVIEYPQTEEGRQKYNYTVESYKSACAKRDRHEMRRMLSEELKGKFYRLDAIDSSTFQSLLSKQTGMTKGEEQNSSHHEQPKTKSIYEQDGYKDRRYTLNEISPQEEAKIIKKFYGDLDLYRKTKGLRERWTLH